jgi:outer membrane protein assembly factor BamB
MGMLACVSEQLLRSQIRAGPSQGGQDQQPKPVTPVVSDGIRYAAEGDGVDESVIASNASDGKMLWKVRVVHNEIDPRMERDVQDVYITDLSLAGSALLVRDEKSRCYNVNLTTKQVEKRLWCHGF